MLPLLALAASTAVAPIVSTEWLQANLNDPSVRIVDVSDSGQYAQAHIPGARSLDHMATLGDDHRLAPFDVLARVWSKAGADDNAHIVLYSNSPMTTGWMYMSLAAIGHADRVSLLDGGIRLWQSEKRPVSAAVPPPGTGTLTVKPAPDIIVDAAWVRERLQSSTTRILDVRTMQEWNNGHLPNATFILWQDLFADLPMQKFKSPDEIRALLVKTGVAPGQDVVTYCAVGMRASLMYWAVRSVGIPARVYVGSWQDWSRGKNPTVK